VLAAAALSVGGGAQPPRGERLAALHARLAETAAAQATLAGARILADDSMVTLAREPGRKAADRVDLVAGETTVWDGRFELRTSSSGLTVGRLAGLAARLPSAEQAALRRLPPAARPALPAIIKPDGEVTSPVLAPGPVSARCLVRDRFAAACGAISKEPAT
jgi:tRNA(Ile)-lysidine synthase